MTELELSIKNHAQLYYEGNPEITDNEFDRLVEALRSENPESELLSKIGWGYEPKNSPLEKFPHKYAPMNGIDTKVTPSEFAKTNSDKLILVSAKLDGASVGIYYKDGILEKALTRGNGETGLDITDKISKIVPTVLLEKVTVRVRGEFVLPRETFIEKYKDAKSPRNTATGFLNKKDWDADSINDFMLIAYTVTKEDGEEYTPMTGYAFLRNNGFHVVQNRVCTNSVQDFNEDTANELLDSMRKYRGLTIDCDGLVTGSGDERIAIKWMKDTELTKVTNIRWQVSRLGKLTPVVEFEPIDLCGATLSNVSGFNAKYIEENAIGVGSTVEITRSGDVIPYIVSVSESTGADIPKRCPECGSEVYYEGVDIKCINPFCYSIVFDKVINFVNSVSEIRGLGNSLIESYIDYFQIISLFEFVNHVLTVSQSTLQEFVDNTQGIGDTALNLILELQRKLMSPIPSDKILCGLGLPGIGSVYAKKLFTKYTVREFNDMLLNSEDAYFDVLNITGRKSIESYREDILYFFGLLVADDLVVSEDTEKEELLVCITGKLSVTRKLFLEELSKYNIHEAPITKASILITDNPEGNSSKNKYANEHDIPKMSEQDFRIEYLQ